ncbi:GtrA family protein [uncultured Sphingomonas sp.]|uniref:GtrA family protein n=1 Tax=uncultured Sphingomonas sp. TaxID=158754 RepID=UPI0025D595A0|nr:GtrA family protein [uncultured Sphingomonas sp.]
MKAPGALHGLFASSPRYLAVSGFCVALNVALLVALDRLGLHYTVAVIAAALVLIPTSYALHLALTYRVASGADTFLRYAGAQLINVPAGMLLFFLLRDCAGLPMVWAAPVVTGLMFLYNLTSSFWAIAMRRPATR